MRPGTYVLLFTSPLNAALNYLFVYTMDMGILGAPVATGISYVRLPPRESNTWAFSKANWN